MPDHAAMRAPVLLIPGLVFLAANLLAADPYGKTPMLGQIGGTSLSSDLRDTLDGRWGGYAGLAVLVAEKGLLGMPSLDVDVRFAPGKGGDLTSVESSYAERSLVGDRWWLGAGLGANWMRLSLKGKSQIPVTTDKQESKWGVGGKGMIGMLISNRFFVEGTYHYTPKILGTDTTSVSVGIGYWF